MLPPLDNPDLRCPLCSMKANPSVTHQIDCPAPAVSRVQTPLVQHKVMNGNGANTWPLEDNHDASSLLHPTSKIFPSSFEPKPLIQLFYLMPFYLPNANNIFTPIKANPGKEWKKENSHWLNGMPCSLGLHLAKSGMTQLSGFVTGMLLHFHFNACAKNASAVGERLPLRQKRIRRNPHAEREGYSSFVGTTDGGMLGI